jgi:hypothetical protein
VLADAGILGEGVGDGEEMGIAGFTVGGVAGCFTISVGATSWTKGRAELTLALLPAPKEVLLCRLKMSGFTGVAPSRLRGILPRRVWIGLYSAKSIGIFFNCYSLHFRRLYFAQLP